MNKKRVEENIGNAYDCLKESVIVKNGNEIDHIYRSYISTFGASVTTGNLLAAVAFFSQDGQGDGSRSVLMKVLFDLLRKDKEAKKEPVEEESLFAYVRAQCKDVDSMAKTKEEILDYAVAIKLAMNLFVVKNKNTKKNKK